jgi:hypothetical protein
MRINKLMNVFHPGNCPKENFPAYGTAVRYDVTIANVMTIDDEHICAHCIQSNVVTEYMISSDLIENSAQLRKITEILFRQFLRNVSEKAREIT